MVVTGNRILDALDFLKERVKTLDTQFQASLYRFADEESKRDPRDILGEYEALQARIARLQEAQADYNLRVEVEVLGERMTLQRVLHLIASANRVKALWAKAVSPEEAPSYQYMALRAREKDSEYARRVISVEAAQDLAASAARRALAFKQAIRSGNAREVEMDVPEDLLE